MAHPPVPVAATDPGREHAQDDPVRRARWIVDVRNNERLLEGAHHGGAHRPIVATVDPLSLPPDELRALGHHVWDRLVDRWEQLDDQPPIAPIDPDFGRHSIAPCPDSRATPQQAIDELFDERPHPRPARRPPALLRPHRQPEQPDQRARRPDRHRPQRLRGKLDRGRGRLRARAGHDRLAEASGWACRDATEGILVSGGSVGTLTALAAAAHDRAEDRDQATGYVSEHTHAATAKAWRILGFNPANLRVLKADPAYRLQPSPIEAAIHLDREAGLRPFLLVGTAGTTSTGSVDPLHDLAELATHEGLWFHVDGAYGAPARLTPTGKDLLTGIERADSLVLDPHKWLFQPYEIGAVLVRHPGCSSTRSRSTAPTCATATPARSSCASSARS